MSPKRYLPHLMRLLLTVGLIVLVALLPGLILIIRLEGWPLSLSFNHIFIMAGIVSPVLVALALLPFLVSRFIRDLYATGNLEDAHAFLNRLVFGTLGFSPYLLIKEGRVARGEKSILHRVGGPGFLVIYHDSAVVTEQFGRLKRVLAPGFRVLGRFEQVWEVVDLRPQRWVYEVSAMTREGLPVKCQADITFKIDDRVKDERGWVQRKQPTDKEPFPYTEEAVFRAATSKWIREPERDEYERTWAGRVVIGSAEGILRSILAEYRLDWLLAPAEPGAEHPREVIRKRLEEKLRDAAPGVGAIILRVDLGEITVGDAVKERIPQQWIETWQAEWERRALVSRVEGEAELLRVDAARVQAQAEMLITLTQALQSAATTPEEVQPYLLATRLIETLCWMSYDPYGCAFMPPEALRTLQRLQTALLPGPSPEEGAEGKG